MDRMLIADAAAALAMMKITISWAAGMAMIGLAIWWSNRRQAK